MYFGSKSLTYTVCRNILLWVVFSCSWWCPLKHKCFEFDEIQFIFLLLLLLLVSYLRNCCLIQDQKDLCLFSSKNLRVLVLAFKSLIHFELIFIGLTRKFIEVLPEVLQKNTILLFGQPFFYGVREGLSLILLLMDI